MLSAETINTIAVAARNAGLNPAALLAVVDVESGGRTHAMVHGRKEPLIRFEGHYFDRRLSPANREIARRAGLAAASPGAVPNPPGQAARWRLLAQAAQIDRRAAYESTSWGVGQVMGAHWEWLGYDSVDALVDEARAGLEGQLRLMMRYMERAGLVEALRNRDWAAFARGYNGPAYARNSYHIKLALAFRRYNRKIQPEKDATTASLRKGDRGGAVRTLQTWLCALGHPVSVDGAFGPETHAAVIAFQRRMNLTADGIVGPLTRRAMETALPLPGFMRTFRNTLAALWRRVRHYWHLRRI